jgi:oligoendopeptidase F
MPFTVFVDLPDLHDTPTLTDLYRRTSDPQISRTKRALQKKIKDFRARYHKLLNGRAFDPAEILRGFHDYEEILEVAGTLFSYANLEVSFRATHANERFVAKIEKWFYRNIEVLKWFEYALGELTSEEIATLLHHPSMTPARAATIRHAQDFATYVVKRRERYLNERELETTLATDRWENTLARLVIPARLNGHTRYLTVDRAKDRLRSEDPAIRKAVTLSLETSFRRVAPRIVPEINTILKAGAQIDQIRRFPSLDTEFLLENDLQDGALDALSRAVLEERWVVTRYYRLKQSFLHLRGRQFRDVFAPLGKPIHFSYQEAQSAVASALNEFSPRLAEELLYLMRRRCIDAVPRRNKQINAGAGVPSPVHLPRGSMHYLGSVSDVITLAHEWGHMLAFHLARVHGALGQQAGSVVSEIHSTFLQTLVESWLIQHSRNPHQKFQLVCERLEEAIVNIWGTQVLSLFEDALHARYRDQGDISADDCVEDYVAAHRQVYGESVRLGGLGRFWWVHKTHLSERRYVASYRMALPISYRIVGLWRRYGRKVAHEVEDLLAAGGTQPLSKLVAPFGIDIKSARGWKRGLTPVKRLLWQAEGLYRELNGKG